MTLLKNDIYWVGYVDWNVRDFHSYETVNGATYNAYLVKDEKTALIDTVKAPFADNLLRNLAEHTPLVKIDYVVCNHAEPDHSGALPRIMASLPNATLVCNEKCRDTLAGYYDIGNWKIQVIGPNDRLELGHRSLSFVNIPMVHWPESMVSWMPEESILFSNDAFGQHLATSVRFDDEWDLAQILHEAKTYYANIVAPYGKQVIKTLEAAKGLGIQMIAPSHGLIWRKNLSTIFSCYTDWATGKYAPKIVVLYDSMWESTTRMAEEICRGASAVSKTLDVKPLHVRKTGLTRIALEMLDAPAAAFGSATLNTQVMPQMAAAMTYIKGLKFRQKTAFAFGSSGWGLGGPEVIDKWLEEVKYPVLCPPVKAKFRPDVNVFEQCRTAGSQLARIALDNAEK